MFLPTSALNFVIYNHFSNSLLGQVILYWTLVPLAWLEWIWFSLNGFFLLVIDQTLRLRRLFVIILIFDRTNYIIILNYRFLGISDCRSHGLSEVSRLFGDILYFITFNQHLLSIKTFWLSCFLNGCRLHGWFHVMWGGCANNFVIIIVGIPLFHRSVDLTPRLGYPVYVRCHLLTRSGHKPFSFCEICHPCFLRCGCQFIYHEYCFCRRSYYFYWYSLEIHSQPQMDSLRMFLHWGFYLCCGLPLRITDIRQLCGMLLSGYHI